MRLLIRLIIFVPLVLLVGFITWMNLTPGYFQYGPCGCGQVGYYTDDEIRSSRFTCNNNIEMCFPGRYLTPFLPFLSYLDFNRGPKASTSTENTADFILTTQNQDQTIEVPLGKMVKVLPASLTLKWSVTYDHDVLQLLSQNSEVSATGSEGWLFKAMKLGTSLVTLRGLPLSPIDEAPPPIIRYYVKVINQRYPPDEPPTSTPTPAGQFCGGIANIQCPSGFSCKLEGKYPDAGGVCVKKGLFGF